MLIPSAVYRLRGDGNAIEPAGSIAGGGLPPDTAAELSALAERLATHSRHHRIDWSDSWTDEDLQDFRAASLRRLETEESEESQLTAHRSELTVIGHLSDRDWTRVKSCVRAAFAI
jgi:hypothetical protein